MASVADEMGESVILKSVINTYVSPTSAEFQAAMQNLKKATDELSQKKKVGWTMTAPMFKVPKVVTFQKYDKLAMYGKGVLESAQTMTQTMLNDNELTTPIKADKLIATYHDAYKDLAGYKATTHPPSQEELTSREKQVRIHDTARYRLSGAVKSFRASYLAGCTCRFCKALDDAEGVVASRYDVNRFRLLSIPAETIRTQKALGMKMLIHAAEQGNFCVPTTTFLAQDLRQLRPIMAAAHQAAMSTVRAGYDASRALNRGAFWARPCPVTPRHGFVPSRECRTLADLQAAMREAKKADKDAELLIQTRIAADWSAILTSAHATIGPGNDGATAGRNSVMLRLLPASPKSSPLISTKLLRSSGVPEGQEGYCEIVGLRSGTAYLAQLRAGPQLPATRDFIPQDMKVARVRTLGMSDNEFAWEKEAIELSREKGVVVYHPGGSMASHYGVHCVLNGIPYVSTTPPEVGSTLVQISDDGNPHPEALLQGLQYGLAKETTFTPVFDWGRRALFAIFMLHNYPIEHGEEASWMLGMGAGWLWKLMTAACLGEFRHVRKYPRPGETFPAHIPWFASKGRVHRESVFDAALPVAGEDLLSPLVDATDDFLRREWPGGYGGLTWGRSGLLTLRFWDEIQALRAAPTVETAKSLVVKLNTLVHAAHNGGLLLDKFASHHDMDLIAQMDRATIIRSVFSRYQENHALMQKAATSKHIPSLPVLHWLLDPAMQTYADSKDSCKRCEHPTGSLKAQQAFAAEEGAAKAIGQWLIAWGTYLDFKQQCETPEIQAIFAKQYERDIMFYNNGYVYIIGEDYIHIGGYPTEWWDLTVVYSPYLVRYLPGTISYECLNGKWHRVVQIEGCQFWPAYRNECPIDSTVSLKSVDHLCSSTTIKERLE